MNYKKIVKSMRQSIFLAASLVMISSTANAVNLAAVERTWNPAVGDPVTMWGFIEDTTDNCSTLPVVDWELGPELTDTNGAVVGGNLEITLRNCLTVPVSIIIPGQMQQNAAPERNGDGRITALTYEVPAKDPTDLIGQTDTYTWLAVSDGVYLYQSGSHAAQQVHMGLYGVMKVGEYTPTSREVTLVYSEIDPNLHALAAAATPLNYKPSYFLLNGKEQHEPILVGDLSAPTALNFLNAGLDFHVPALEGGYFNLVAEDGNEYPPFEKRQYSVNIAAGKTIDAIWTPTASGSYPLFDRRGHGMPVQLVVVKDVSAPFAQDDHYGFVNNHGWVDVDHPQAQLSVAAADGLLANDHQLEAVPPAVDPEVVLFSGPGAGTVGCEFPAGVITDGVICADGSFIYTPTTVGFNGPDTFVYNIAGFPDPASQGTVTIDVNAGPMAVADGTTVWRKSKPGKRDRGDPRGSDRNTIDLLANDSDNSTIDPASVVVVNMKQRKNGKWRRLRTANKGIVRNKGNGIITYKPRKTFDGTDTFSYRVMDIQGAVSNEATVTITVVRRLADLPDYVAP